MTLGLIGRGFAFSPQSTIALTQLPSTGQAWRTSHELENVTIKSEPRLFAWSYRESRSRNKEWMYLRQAEARGPRCRPAKALDLMNLYEYANHYASLPTGQHHMTLRHVDVRALAVA